MVAGAPSSLSDAAATPIIGDRRIIGLDVARAIAMLGMVIAHYAWPDDSGTVLDGVASAVDGRAMPLFVMLGGVGATILTSRSPHPDRSLLIRAAMLAPMGLILQELTKFIAIILHYYSVFFVAAIVLRRLPSRVLVIVTVITGATGSWTYQVLGPRFVGYRNPSDLIDEPLSLGWSLIFEGFYPFFPVASFFIIGMIIARTDLRAPSVASRLSAVGAGVALLVIATADPLVDLFGVNTGGWETDESTFVLSRLLDDDGHSKMLAWVIGSAGSSAAIIGFCLLLAPRSQRWLRPLVSLGQLALTFYIFQAVFIRFVTHPDQTELPREFLNVLAIYLGFMAFAWLWRLRFRSGPFEALFRLGSSSGQKAGRGRSVPQMVTRSPRRSSGK